MSLKNGIGFLKEGGMMSIAAFLVWYSTQVEGQMTFVYIGAAIAVVLVKYADKWMRSSQTSNLDD